MRNDSVRAIAFGGVLAALAVVILCMSGLLPLSTYACPVLCIVLTYSVLRSCGKRIAWAWYAAVALLGLLLGTEKEAAAVYVFLGYYPLVKPTLDKTRLRFLWKALLFNSVIFMMYWILLYLIGMEQLAKEFGELDAVWIAVLLILGNGVFFLLDTLLTKLSKSKIKKSK